MSWSTLDCPPENCKEKFKKNCAEFTGEFVLKVKID